MPPPTPRSHKPRKKRKGDETAAHTGDYGVLATDPNTGNQRPAFPLVGFLWPAKGTLSQWAVLPLVLMVVGLFRWSTAFWDYSGFQAPPMHGDFEAQRHWMELTISQPMSQWYFRDLEWWGLDYPPLTAYHSWILGKIGSAIDQSWFAWDTSRGLDDSSLKVYMRATAFISEYLVYIPATVIFLRRQTRLQGINSWEASIALVAILMQPATILIDHGHFQYNTVMLGLTLASMSSILAGRFLWSCVFFVGALGFKQMALFYAPAVFAYLLGICITPKLNILRLSSIALATIISFVALFAPLLLGTLYDHWRGIDAVQYAHFKEPPLLDSLSVELDRNTWYYQLLVQLAQSIHRIFPFARGLFEDKVANFWCAIHTFHKLNRYSGPIVQRAALLATSAAITPPCLILFLKPRKDLILSAFAATSWGFFLCSFQVHEKNVLLPLLPMTFMLGSAGGMRAENRAWIGFANILGCWTMFPLLARDGLRVPYVVLTIIYRFLLDLPPFGKAPTSLPIPAMLAQYAIYGIMFIWHVVEYFVPPPKDKPDLWVVLNVLVGAAGFGLCYLWCLWTLSSQSGLLAWKKEDVALDAKGKEKAKTL